MTKEREMLELISEYVRARANVDSGIASDNSLDEIATAFGEVLRREDEVEPGSDIPPIVTRADEEQLQ